ncbi:hypothetical protein Plec18167_007591 [Paecilomyces lecythidis]|uniref:F-box domain-containing protein n=1 Tax=Paecilomyces lecythidis TaxID=3004212 RepID=A0ABR3X302_9EURO
MRPREYWLPPEILRQVISHFIASADFDLVPYATVNRDWQAIIESITFATIYMDDQQRLEEFEQIMTRKKERQSYIRTIYFTVELESYDLELRREYETPEEHSRNNKIFEETILFLFRALATWPEHTAGIKLQIDARSLSDSFWGDPDETIREQNELPHGNLFDARFERSYLQIQEENLQKIPQVNVVTELVVRGCMEHRLIRPASCASIASRLPRLHTIDLSLWDNEKRDIDLRKANRNGMRTANHDI